MFQTRCQALSSKIDPDFYGTILVDLEKRGVVQLLGERSVETSKTWLRKHPEIDLVSRDRGKIFREAATDGAPQAKQVVDRFHLQVRRIGAYSIPFGERRG